MITYVCPNCGATIEVRDPTRDFLVCEYCGARLPLSIRIDPSSYSFTTNSHEETAFLDSFFRSLGRLMARLCRGFSILTAKIRQKPRQALLIALSVLVLGSGSVFAIHQYRQTRMELSAHIRYLDRLNKEKDAYAHQAEGEALVPASLPTTGDYRVPYKHLRDAGFLDITLVPKKDLILGHVEEENSIVEITVDGSPVFETGVWIEADTPIVITYHTFLWNRSAPSGPAYPSSSEN